MSLLKYTNLMLRVDLCRMAWVSALPVMHLQAFAAIVQAQATGDTAALAQAKAYQDRATKISQTISAQAEVDK